MKARVLGLLACLALAAPARSADIVFAVTGTSSAMAQGNWGRLTDEWRVQMARAAKEADLPLSYQQGEPRPTGKPGILVGITVRRFRFVAPAVRGFTGRWAGHAELSTSLKFMDLATGDVLVDRPAYAISDSMDGRFGEATNQQVRQLSLQIMSDVRVLLTNPPQPAKAEPAPANAPDTADATEIVFWKSVRDSSDPQQLRAYLERYPSGTFAEIARSRLARLETR